MTNEANKQTGVLRRIGTIGAIIIVAALATGATFLGYGVDANLPWPVTSNTTIAAKYCGGTVQAGTGSTGFFTVTVPGVSGFPSNCVVNITNGDTTTLRGKGIAGLSGSGCSTQNILWPGQACKIGIVNGGWAVLSRPGRWRPPGGTTNFYADFTNGTDATGATDGLAPGAAAFKSAQNCLVLIDDQIDFNGVSQTQADCNMAAATTDTAGLHLPYHDFVGAQGGNAIRVIGASLGITGAISNGGLCEITVSSTSSYSANEIVSVYGVGGATGCNGTWRVSVTDGTHLTLQSTAFGGSYTSGGTVTNGSNFNVTGDVAIGCFFSTVVAFSNIYLQSNVGDFNGNDNCYNQLGDGIILGGNPSGALVSLTFKAQLVLFGDLGIASGAGNFGFEAIGGGLFNSFGEKINFLPGVNPSFSGVAFAYADTQGQVSFLGSTINLNGNTVTGQRCQATSSGLIISGTGNANTYFPGNSNCTQSSGGNIDGVVIPPNPSASTLGGIESYAAVTHQWLNSISTSGAPSSTQPAFADLSSTPTTLGGYGITNARTQLTANVSYYVNNSGSSAACGPTGASTCSAGNDSNNCLTPATACSTMQHAVNLIIYSIDLNGFTATIYPAHGNNTAFVCTNGPVVGQSVFGIQGDSTAPGAVVMVATSAVAQVKDGCTVSFSNVAFADNASHNASAFISTGTGNCGHVDLNNITFGALGIGTALTASYCGSITVVGSNSVTGSENAFVSVSGGGAIEIDGTVNGSSGITWGTGAIVIQEGGTVLGVTGSTFTGFSGVSGPRCYMSSLASPDNINPNSVFPGSTDCVVAPYIGALGVQKGSGGSSTIDYGTNHWPMVSGGGSNVLNKYEQLANAGMASGGTNTVKCSLNGTSEVDCTAAQTQAVTEQGMTLLNVVTVSAAASISDTTSITSAYNDYLIVLDSIVPATNAVNFNCQVQSGGSFQATNYLNNSGGQTAYLDLTLSTGILANTAGGGLNSEIWLHNANSSNWKSMVARNTAFANTSAGFSEVNGGAAWTGAGTVTGIQCQSTSGNITGSMSIFGLRKAL